VRGHLVNDNLHGPGVASNLVPITKTMNSDMESKAEAPAKAAIRERGKLFFYRAEVTFWPDPKPVGSFPQRIVVTWGTAKRKVSNKKEFEADQTRGTVPITMPVKPPAVATAFRPTINGGSPTQLEAAIKPSGPVTGYFVSNVLLGEFEDKGAYTSKTNMQDRLYTNVRASIVASQGAAVAAARRGYVQATYAAITKGDVKV
jgi:hypothetical protein